ncbi:MAG: tetratricopeptide repeat protein [Agarilytica sp.]
MNGKHAVLLSLITLLVSGWQGTAFAETARTISNDSIPNSASTRSDLNLLKLDHNIQDLLDREVRPQTTKLKRLARLQSLLFSKDELHIRYQGDLTLTAIETFERRAGNCISLANLFIASARYLGIEARYQFVKVEQQWQRVGSLIEVPTHINVQVKTGKTPLNIEFNGAYAANSHEKKLLHSPISDLRAKAEFFNNLGAQKLKENRYNEAIEYFHIALEQDANSDSAWSNLGVAYKKTSREKRAEQSYLKALKLAPNNKPVAKNLYILYRDIGAKRKAKKYAKLVEKYSRKNPYYLEKLALDELRGGNYKSAKKFINKAIRAHKTEASFYHTLARIHWQTKNIKGAHIALQQAVEYANSDHSQTRYDNKLTGLNLSAR